MLFLRSTKQNKLVAVGWGEATRTPTNHTVVGRAHAFRARQWRLLNA